MLTKDSLVDDLQLKLYLLVNLNTNTLSKQKLRSNL